jgi:hypothetical protein
MSGAFSLTRGNIDFFTGRGGALFSYQLGRHRFISSSSMQLGISGSNVFLDRRITHLRYQLSLFDKVGLEALSQLTYDRVWRLRFRAIAGAGVFSHLLRGEHGNLTVGATYLLEGQEFSRGQFPDSGRQALNHRASTYITGRVALDSRVALVQNVFLQPRFDDPSDFRAFIQSDLQVRIIDGKMAVGLVFIFMYDSRPAATIKHVDTTTMAQLTVPL